MGNLWSALKGKFKYLVLWLLSIPIFALVIFPYDDLSGFVGSQVARFSNNSLFVQFEKMNLSLWPFGGITLKGVSVDTAMTPTLNAQELTITPSVSALINQQPGGLLSAKMFRGDIDVSLRPGKKTESGNPRSLLEIKGTPLNLQELNQILQMPLPVKGKLNIDSRAQADLTLQEQPEAEVSIKVDNFEIPSAMLPTPMGDVPVPEVKLRALEIRGKLSSGRLVIEEGKLGKEGDELFGTVKGNMAIALQNRGGIQAVIGDYSFDVDISLKKDLNSKLNSYLNFFDQYRKPTTDGFRYSMRLSGKGPYAPPKIGALQ